MNFFKAEGRKAAIAQLNLAVLLFAMPAVISQSAAFSPTTVVVGRGLFAALALWSFLSIGKDVCFQVSAKVLRITALLGVMYAVHLWAFFYSVAISTATIAILTFCSYPLFTTFLEPLVFKTKLRLSNLISVGFVLLGMLVIALEQGISGPYFEGILWGTFSGALFSVISLINKAQLKDISASVLGFYQNLFILLCSLPFLLIETPTLTSFDMAQLVFMGVVCSAFAHTLFISTFKNVEVQLASVFLSLEPIYGALLAYLLLGEAPTVGMWVASVLLILASVLATRR